mgnify:CR=1 FL=1
MRKLVFKRRKWFWEEDGFRVVRSVARCGPGCHCGCGVLLYVKDGRLVKVEGDPDFPFNQGRLCVRCLALPQVVYSPQRLKYPMIREGERGENKWRRISWKEAYDIITEKLSEIREKYGPQSVLFCEGTARDIQHWIRLFAYTYGSPNVTGWAPLYGAACYRPRVAVQKTMLGATTVMDCAQFFLDRYDNPNWRPPKCIIIWGDNPIASNPDGFHGSWIVDCMRRGSELIVIDPRRTWLATRAKIWLQIRPGTDAALALGMLNVIINERLYDEDFVNKWCYGFDKLKERVQEYPPEKVADITWIPKEKIIEAARMYATSKPAAIKWGVPLDHTANSINTARAIIALMAITGNIDVPGGNIFVRPAHNAAYGEAVGFDLLSSEAWSKRLGVQYPLASFFMPGAHTPSIWDAILTEKPYPVKAIVLFGSNPLLAYPRPRRILEALKKLELFVVIDLFMTPTAHFADFVLPAAAWPEIDSYRAWWAPLVAIPKAVDPPGGPEGPKSDNEIIFELGKRVAPQHWKFKDLTELLNEMIKESGLTYEELKKRFMAPWEPMEYRKYEKGKLRPDGKPGFNTPTGKVELYSTIMEAMGLEPLPSYKEPVESPKRKINKEKRKLIFFIYRGFLFLCQEKKKKGRKTCPFFKIYL